MRALTALLAGSLLAGCATTGSQGDHRYYVLEARGPETTTTTPRIDATLLVAPTTARRASMRTPRSPTAAPRAFVRTTSSAAGRNHPTWQSMLS